MTESGAVQRVNIQSWKCPECGNQNPIATLQCECNHILSTSHSIYRLHYDFNVSYGDGAQGAIRWPIFAIDLLDISDETKHNLKHELIKLGKANNDYRENEPILNIIDPDLYVLKHFDRSKYEIKYTNGSAGWNTEGNHKGYFIRSSYSWLATQIMQTDDNTISIVSPIHNLQPRAEYNNIYTNIERVFTKMLPLFNQFESFKNRKEKQFQCIIKSQRYEIANLSGYDGHWHQEGLSENIKYVGLYYFEKSAALKGGNLKFANLQSPEQSYRRNAYYWPAVEDRYKIEYELSVQQGTAVVFDNQNLVHRVRMLKNKTNDKQMRYRSFLAFFVIDPEKPIESTREYPSLKRVFYVRLIQDVVCKGYGLEAFHEDVVSLICEFGNVGMTKVEAMQLRNKDIEYRKSKKGRFGTYHFGNSGDKVWFCDPDLDGTNRDIHWLRSTDSQLTDTDKEVHNHLTVPEKPDVEETDD